MKTLVVDLHIKRDGHKHGFMQQLINYGSTQVNSSFVFLSNAGQKFESCNDKHIVLNEAETLSLGDKLGLSRYMAEWRLILKYARKYQIDKIVLLELDIYQIPLGLLWGKIPISGIWFRPYKRMKPSSSDIGIKLKFWIQFVKKRLQLGVAINNPLLRKVFILNDEKMPSWHSKSRFFYLPDPYFPCEVDANFHVRAYYGIAKDAIILLQFGFIDERKNTENILLALHKVSSKNPIVLLVVGKFALGYEQILCSLSLNLQVIMDDRFVSDGEMAAIFKESDIVLRMNLDFYGSSGVIGIAAAYNKVSLGSNTGVMAEVMQKYQLGELAEPTNINWIASTLQKLIDDPAKRTIDGSFYIKDHTLEAFASVLLN